MPISMMSIDRITEEELRKDPEALQDFYRRGRFFRSDIRRLTDEQLIEKLREFGLPWDRDGFCRHAQPFYSAAAMARQIKNLGNITLPDGMCADWPWMTFAILWERWLPERPCFEMLDDWMQQGYELQQQEDGAVPACEIWWRVWKALRRIFAETTVTTVDDMDNAFGGTQSVFNWMQDFELELGNASRCDLRICHQRIEFCEAMIPRVAERSELTVQNFRRAIAESQALLGNIPLAEQLYEGWLAADPQWGWGWIGWSDLFGTINPVLEDLAKAESLLHRGLDVPDVNDRDEILERLALLCEDTGRASEAEEFHRQSEAEANRAWEQKRHKFSNALERMESNSSRNEFTSRETHVPRSPLELPESDFSLDDGGTRIADTARLTSHKIGRNDPCFCGSGKKFKKCCGKVT